MMHMVTKIGNSTIKIKIKTSSLDTMIMMWLRFSALKSGVPYTGKAPIESAKYLGHWHNIQRKQTN